MDRRTFIKILSAAAIMPPPIDEEKPFLVFLMKPYGMLKLYCADILVHYYEHGLNSLAVRAKRRCDHLVFNKIYPCTDKTAKKIFEDVATFFTNKDLIDAKVLEEPVPIRIDAWLFQYNIEQVLTSRKERT